MVNQTNMFGDRDIHIPGNSSLESTARLILRLVDGDRSLLDGNRVGDIDRKLRLAVWMDQGLRHILKPEQIEEFSDWMLDSKKSIDQELIRRARQYLVQHDYIRLSGAALKDAEQQRARLTQSFRR